MIDLHPCPTIDVDQLRAMLERHEPVTILDIREAADRAEWWIPGSLHHDAADALRAGNPNAVGHLVLPDDRPVVTVCQAGRTSLIATAQLRARGYDARSLRGGMNAWSLAWNTAEIPLPGSDCSVVQVRRTGKGCLSYLVGSAGAAAVIDAAIDPEIYVDLAARHGWAITHVLDTHVHADHLSRSRALAALTGATLVLPAQDRVSYPFQPLCDGDLLRVGNATIRALHTPGHTNESTAYLLDDRALFTGDTQFLAGVGRPDLEASADAARARAHALYRSLRRLAALPADTIVLPGHTSAPVPFDGQPIAATLGEVTARVDLLRLPEAAFVEAVLARIPPTPPNHHRIVGHNEAGELPAGSPAELEAGANRCAVA